VLHVEPDAWQVEFLRAFVKNQRLALKACKGPGKSAALAWVGWNFLLTRPHPKVVCTSITGQNLKDGLWTEMSKWQQKSPLLSKAFTWAAERITSQ
jgi:phage terminase large subunit